MSTKATGNKKHLTLLIVLPLNMVSAVGKISRRLPAESTRILLPFQGDSASPFPGSSFSKRNPAEALRMRAFSELCKAAYLRESDL